MGGREKTSPEGVCLCCCVAVCEKMKLYEEKILNQKETENKKCVDGALLGLHIDPD